MNGPRTMGAIVYLTPLEAMALAQLAKRITWDELLRCSVDRDEAEIMRSAVEQLRRGLADSGFEPR